MTLDDADTLPELLDRRVAHSGDDHMLIDQDDVLTFADVRAAAWDMAARLAAMGFDEHSTIAWQLPSISSTLITFIALRLLGTRQCPLLMGFRERELGVLLPATNPDAILVHRSWRGFDHESLARGVVAGAQLSTSVIVVEDLLSGPAGLGTWTPPGDPDRIHYMYTTSGSTGTPKVVCHTDRSILTGGFAQSAIYRIDNADVAAWITSVGHIGGAVATVQSLACGNACVLIDRFEKGATAELLRRHDVSIINATPAGLEALLTDQRSVPTRMFPRLRYCAAGGSAKSPTLHAEVQATLGGRGLLMAYGMTEISAIAMPSLDDSDEQFERTVGTPVPGLSLRILDETGAEVEPGRTGEIRVRGPMVCDSYLSPTDNADGFDDEGYLRTGDLGSLRADGHLVVTGRSKDIIIRKGENISPREVEDVLLGMPQVREVAVVAVADPAVGERVCAVVVLHDDSQRIDLTDVIEHCRRAGLMIQKTPEQLEIVVDLPRTALGKVNKPALRKSLA
ncbi:MAG: class I adenylate-forming enzyme family protein [Ilumatobacteraceae bacterium]